MFGEQNPLQNPSQNNRAVIDLFRNPSIDKLSARKSQERKFQNILIKPSVNQLFNKSNLAQKSVNLFDCSKWANYNTFKKIPYKTKESGSKGLSKKIKTGVADQRPWNSGAALAETTLRENRRPLSLMKLDNAFRKTQLFKSQGPSKSIAPAIRVSRNSRCVKCSPTKDMCKLNTHTMTQSVLHLSHYIP